MKRIKIFTLLFVLLFATNGIKAQDVSIDQIVGQNLEYNVISTAVPFMMIAPDARSSAMGDVGVSTSPDVYSMHWNSAKYAFIEDDFSVDNSSFSGVSVVSRLWRSTFLIFSITMG